MPAPRSHRPRRIQPSASSSSITSLLVWAIFILLLIGAAIASWIGSFYIFGHPEEPFSNKVLQALKKIEPPKRFELTAAPSGEFLSPTAIFDRYSQMSPSELRAANALLLRNYLRNYEKTPGKVPYVIGDFTILDSFELTDQDLVESGVVALAKSNEDPRVLIEHIFPASPQTVPQLHRTLLTGLDLRLQRRLDLSAIIHTELLKDGRLKLTAVPLLYGSYASTQGPGTFSLEPPKTLLVANELPVLKPARIDAALEKYATYRRRVGLPEEESPAATPGGNLLVRVSRPEPVEGTPPPVPTPAPAASIATPSPSPEVAARVLPALPVLPAEPITRTLPDESAPLGEDPEASALPIEIPIPELTEATPTPQPTPSPAISPTPSPTPTAVIANTAGRNWKVYEPGKMPRGRLVSPADMPQLATRGTGGERLYLQGSFVVTASGSDRAVLRSRSAVSSPIGGKAANVRIIVDFPGGTTPPQKDAAVSRDALRPFEIMDISSGEDGQINVRVREITTP